MKIVLATSNKHKVEEINAISKDMGIEFILPPAGFDPDETGKTFKENSYIKAYEAWKQTHNWALADDSGLCIDALDGMPGIYSARYDKTPELRIKKVLHEMNGKSNRTAHFTCSMTLINPKGEVAFSYEGICEGEIGFEPKGNNGFGYDPIFVVKGSSRTIAEMSEDEKNRISHRSIALTKVLEFLNNQN